jgi:TonB family protein
MVIEMQSNHFMALSYIVQLFKYDFENKRYCIASLVYYDADGRVIYEDNDILPLWRYIQPETYIDNFYQVAKRFASTPSQTSKETAPSKSSKAPAYSGKVYDVVEQMPSFPGGNEAMMKYLKENVNYPDAEMCVQGRVVVKFIVEPDGSISHAQVARSIDPVFDKEALRVVNNMPKWVPGKQNGRTVRVYYHVPVSFRLE